MSTLRARISTLLVFSHFLADSKLWDYFCPQFNGTGTIALYPRISGLAYRTYMSDSRQLNIVDNSFAFLIKYDIINKICFDICKKFSII